METVAVVFLICMAFAVLVLARSAWRFFRGNEEPTAAGSFGQQVFGKRERPRSPKTRSIRTASSWASSEDADERERRG
jgi:hypothetical protein